MIYLDFSRSFAESFTSLGFLLKQLFEAAPAHLCRHCASEHPPWVSVTKEGEDVLITINILLA